ncbi:TetR/AcrR family transcriptional regulator [Haladaptatus halobius]|jgi:AcrR family transcriptional regulator|uniref:TetR/AcrR family transcriptional regulator n=1 Tax=Haladaptatus halobius TaxID=2884875 RepID=UPI001D0A514E|nr:TetR/AcrR family transcriptional regulator [Haladaptatus halobius]
MNDNTTDELMRATYTALCKHGYAALRMQDIANESSKSKATLHYHYDTKHDLLHAFLEYLYESFAERIETLEGETPTERLIAFIEIVLTPRDRDKHQEFQTAILEIKAQGPYDETYRTELKKFDQLLSNRLHSILQDGQEQEVFRRDINADDTADFIVTVLNGAQTRYVAVGHPVDRTRQELIDYIVRQLLIDDTEEVVAE